MLKVLTVERGVVDGTPEAVVEFGEDLQNVGFFLDCWELLLGLLVAGGCLCEVSIFQPFVDNERGLGQLARAGDAELIEQRFIYVDY